VLREFIRRNGLRLIMVGFLAVPAAVALAAMLPGFPGYVPPLVLIASGIGYGWLAIHLVTDLAKLYRTEDTVPGHELRDVPAERMFSDKPHAIWVPYLISGSWMLVIVGLVWLALVEWRLAVAVIALFVAFYLWWKRRRPRPEDRPGS
jgi:hypothetical protein